MKPLLQHDLLDRATLNPAAARRPPLFGSPWAGLLLVGLAFVAAAALSWRKWPDIQIDFGLQLYLPWQISSGGVLYRDLHYLPGGPLSQHFNALLFKLFGTSFLTLVWANLILAATLLLLLYRAFLASTDVWTATFSGLALVLVFAFSHYGELGNYNYITPYCHEVVHGLLLSIVGVALLSTWLRGGPLWLAGAAGLCAGLVFLPKPEVFGAFAACSTAAFLLALAVKTRRGPVLRSLAAFILAALAPLLSFLLYFHQFESWRQSFRSVAFAWWPLLATSVQHGVFYQWCMGLDRPILHLGLMFLHFFVVLLLLGICAFLFRQRMNPSRLWPLVCAAPVLALASRFDWTDCGRSLPLLNLLLCAWLLTQYLRSPSEKVLAFPLLWSIFALTLLAKLGLFCRIWHYGFALAMPAFVSAVYLLHWQVPSWLEGYGVRRRLYRGTIGAVLLLGFALLFAQSLLSYRHKTFPVGRGRDLILTRQPASNPAGAAIQSTLGWLTANSAPGATLAVLPEGIMLNYLSRHSNPTHYFTWMLPELEVFGAANMFAAFKQSSPDFVLILPRDVAEYGMKPFGHEERFGQALMEWVRRNYEPVFPQAQGQVQDPRLASALLRKKRAEEILPLPGAL